MKKLLLALPIVIVAGLGIMLSGSSQAASPAGAPCQLPGDSRQFAFCDTFDNPSLVTGRSGQLDQEIWGVSRWRGGGSNAGQGMFNAWGDTLIDTCGGTAGPVKPPNDVIICNGQLREAMNDEHDVAVLAMYPKQPFDFAGRTGTIVFDVSNDTGGMHAAWPEIWITDQPIPAPFNHLNSWKSAPRNGIGIKLGGVGSGLGCDQRGDRSNLYDWTVSHVVVSRNYVMTDTEEGSGHEVVTPLACVIKGSPNAMNHVEIRISTNLIEVYATDAGSSVLKHISTISNINVPLTRGLVWLQDAHYNASKSCDALASPSVPSPEALALSALPIGSVGINPDGINEMPLFAELGRNPSSMVATSVLSASNRLQVGRVTAESISAEMVNLKALNGSIWVGQHESYAVGGGVAGLLPSAELPILADSRSRPDPAGFGASALINLRPEGLNSLFFSKLGQVSPSLPTIVASMGPAGCDQGTHTFAWDNFGFDGPFTYRDYSYDVKDNTVGLSGQTSLGWKYDYLSDPEVNVNTLPIDGAKIPVAETARLMFNFYHQDAPLTIQWSINGAAYHTEPWPFPSNQTFTPRTIAFTVPLGELHGGSNNIRLKFGQVGNVVVGNVNIVLVNVPSGGVSSTATPTSSMTPTSTKTPSPPSATPTASLSTSTPTVPATPTATVTVTPTPSPSLLCYQSTDNGVTIRKVPCGVVAASIIPPATGSGGLK